MPLLTNEMIDRINAIEDEVETRMVTIRGRANQPEDPMFDAIFDRYDIVKRLPLADLPATVGKWLALGRSITSITD